MLVRPHFQRLVERARMRPAVRAGFVFPTDREWLQLALSAAFAGFFTPVLIGPEARIRDAAAHAGLDISPIPIANTSDSTHAAVACALELARAGAVRVLVRGSLANEDLLGPIVASGSGLRTEQRLSHAHFLDLSGRAQGLLLADAMLNIAPTLGAKKDIVHNTVELAIGLGIAQPHVAVLAASSLVNPALPSTLDASALKTMGAQGLFGDAIVDGPLPMDAALSADVARAQGLGTEVAGHADILVVPAMEPGALLVRAMTALTGGLAAGLVLGAQLPIVLPSRIDAMEVRMASCVLAALHANRAEGAAHRRGTGRLASAASPVIIGQPAAS